MAGNKRCLPVGFEPTRRLGAFATKDQTSSPPPATPGRFRAWPCKKDAGERAITVFNDFNAELLFGKPGTRDTLALARPIPRHDKSRAGVEPAFTMVRSIRYLHHQRLPLTRQLKIDLSRRMTRRLSEPFKVRPVLGDQLSPRSLRQAPRFGHVRFTARAPGSGSPVPAFAGEILIELARRIIKKPSGALAREGLQKQTVDIAYARSLP